MLMNEVRLDELEEGIVQITLNRPEALNAITHEWVEAFHAVLDRLDSDQTIRVAIVTGAGRGFCAGADLKSDFVANHGVAHSMKALMRLATIMERMIGLRQPIIAAVNGAAAGGGFAVVLASDMRIASESATFHIANARIGLSAGECGISWLFPRVVGLGRSFELMVTGRRFDAAEAKDIGLVSRVVPDDQLIETALELARQIRANSPFGVWMSKEVIYRNLEVGSFRAAIALEARTQMVCGQSADAAEAVAAFAEKRPPKFSAS